MRAQDFMDTVTSAEPAELPAIVGALAQAQAVALALLMAQTRELLEPDNVGLLTMQQVAERLGVPEENARELGRRGILPTVHVGKYVRVQPEDLQDYIDLRRGPVQRSPSATYDRRRDGARQAQNPDGTGLVAGRTRGTRRAHGAPRRAVGARQSRKLGAVSPSGAPTLGGARSEQGE